MKVRTGWLIVWYNGAFHSSSRQTRFCIEQSGGTADSHWRRRCSSKPLHLLSRSLVTIHLCWFWTRQTFEKEKHHSLPSVRLIHSPICLCRFTLHVTPHSQHYANEKCQGETTWLSRAWSEENLPCLHQWGSVPLKYHRHYTGRRGADSGAAPPAPLTQVPLRVTYTKTTNFAGAKGVREKNRNIFLRWIQLCGKILLETSERSSRGPWTLLPNDLAPSLICSSVICQAWTLRNEHTFCTCILITIFLMFLTRPKPFLYYVFM